MLHYCNKVINDIYIVYRFIFYNIRNVCINFPIINLQIMIKLSLFLFCSLQSKCEWPYAVDCSKNQEDGISWQCSMSHIYTHVYRNCC